MPHWLKSKRKLMLRRRWMILVVLVALGGQSMGAFPVTAQAATLSLWNLFASPPAAPGVPRFSLTDVGTLGGGSSSANSVNDLGQATGSSLTASGADHAFLFSDGKLTDLGTLSGSSSEAFGINSLGHVVGYSLTAGQAAQHAFLYGGGKLTDLGTLGGLSSSAGGINDADQVVGYSFTSVQGYSFTTGIVATHAFLYSSGRMADLGTLGGATSVGIGINAVGQVVGNSFTATNSANHAVLYSDGRRIDLGTLGGLNSTGNGINALGQVAQRLEAGGEQVQAGLADNLAQPVAHEIAAGDQTAQVHLDQLGHADVGPQQIPDVGDFLALAEQPHRRHAEAFLIAFGGVGAERPDLHAAHVHHMRGDPDPGD